MWACLTVCFPWGGRQISLCKLVLNWAMEMSCWSSGALDDPASILDLNVGMRCTSLGFWGDEMLLTMWFFVQDLGKVLLCLKTLLLLFSWEQCYKAKATFKQQEEGGHKSLKLGSLDEVQFEMSKQWSVTHLCEQFLLIPAATKGWRREETAGGPELWNLFPFWSKSRYCYS